MSNVIETVKYSLVAGATEQDLVAATKQSQTFISSLPGFLYRSLSQHEETGTWTDVVYWNSMEEAKAAGQQFETSEDCKPLMSLIDPASLDMKHEVIKMSSCQTD